MFGCAQEKKNDQERTATRLPLHYFERLYKNQSRYPWATFNLWLDFDQLCDSDRFFLDSHRYFSSAGAVNILNLRSIPEYNNAPGFDLDSNIALYARADYARIVVLNYILATNEQDTVIYSDLDCDDVQITNPNVKQSIDNYGMAFGRAGSNKACNGYIALQGEKGRYFMREYLWPKANAAFQKNLINHFGAFAKAVNKYRNAHHPDLPRSTWGLVELPLMRTVMPYDENVYSEVCMPKDARIPGSKELV